MNPVSNLHGLRRALLRWYRKHGRDLPWRETRDPYAILVSEVMLQQTQVSTVRPYYDRWLNRFPDFATLAAVSESEVLHAWQGLGYYRRARDLHATAKLVVSQYQGVLPRDSDAIRKLPGLGRYTANAVATFAFDCCAPIVEANITRLLARLFNIKQPVDSAAGRNRLWQIAAELVPTKEAGRFNSALMDLGATICVSRIPKCPLCPVQTFCRARQPQLLPIKKPRPKMVRLTESHLFVRRQNKLLLERCFSRWRGMWMLPLLRRQLRRNPPLHSSIFPFTHHRINLQVYSATGRTIPEIGQRWIRIDQLNKIPIPSPHRRAILACLPLDVGG